ncbi:hypothetical protein E1301_Tti023518 [Triplophysa tibetana]|uniref:Uncharacterized protein n=1 Tax=Triplophysa tibetana TaxID=1572043 RepID=A0A5A9N3B6_9TELE|nr:hypothetical protein E1301_Tti023518 [Triplophysa tibetana]
MVELPVIEVKGGNHQWIQTICETTWKVAERGQVVLVICEDVKTADELHGKMQDGGQVKAEQITLYTISEKHNIEREKFCGGRIIIATNLGGRGTDIKVDESVNKQGGLFVLLTHFPDNRRVEKQIFGRTSRKGNPGMVQMVVNCDHLAPAYQACHYALKESWALWLTLHEDHINRHDDFNQLEADLIKTINGTREKLLQGQSDNFYDHIRQAIVRTDLHCRNKSSNSNGAESYWQKVVNSDPHYKAVALYNQAYITINLGKGDYKADAMKLLGEAKKSIDVYISEVSNTMIVMYLSVTGNKDHSTDYNNFQNQMEARMNIFSCWMKYVDNAMLKLKELEKSKDDAITEECSVYMLSEEKNFIITNELMSLYDFGLGIVFEVKKKPKFCIDALICFILGVVQVLAGILICVFTVGTASQFGMGLISEGVSDMISGIEGMVKGTFDWVSWAISKSISIGLALITAGFSAIKKAVTAVYKVTKSLLNVKQNIKLDQTLVEFISSGVPKAALKKENFKIDSKYEKQMKESVGLLSEEIIPELILDCTTAQDVISKLSEVCDAATELMEKAKLSGVLETAKLVLKVAEYSTRLCEILGAVPTKKIIDQKFVPQFLQSINELQTEITKYDQDGRHQLNDVQRLKEELLQEIAQNVSDKFISSCSDHMTSLMTSSFKSQLTSATGEAVDKVTRRQKTQSFFDDQRAKHNKKSASHKEVQQLSDEDKTKLKQYTEDMCKADRPTTALDVYVLTKTNLLDGKGIRLTIVDENGKQLTEERHPGTNKSAGDIN